MQINYCLQEMQQLCKLLVFRTQYHPPRGKQLPPLETSAFCWNDSSSGHATLRCRSLQISWATLSTCLRGTVACKGGIRRYALFYKQTLASCDCAVVLLLVLILSLSKICFGKVLFTCLKGTAACRGNIRRYALLFSNVVVLFCHCY